MKRQARRTILGPASFSGVNERRALLILCLLGFAWRLVGLDYQSLWRDEVDSLRFASRALPDLLRTFGKPGENGPLFFLVLRPWLAAAGQSEFALRLPAALAGILAIPLTFVLTRRLLPAQPQGSTNGRWAILWPDNVPLLAALLVTVSPYFLWYSQEGKMYSLLVALALGVHLAFLAALQDLRWWRWLIYLFLLGATSMVHFLALLLIPVHVAWLVLLWPRDTRRWRAFLLSLALPTLPYFALVGWWQLRLLTNSAFQTGHPFVPLPEIALVLLVGASQGIATTASVWTLAPFLFLLLAGSLMVHGAQAGTDPIDQRARAGLMARFRAGLGLTQPGKANSLQMMKTEEKHLVNSSERSAFMAYRRRGLLLAWLALPPLLLYAISLSKPLFTDRYLIWILPALLILVALGVAELARIWQPLGGLALAFLLVLGLHGGLRQGHTPIKSDFRTVAAYVRDNWQEGDQLLFLIPYARYTFQYYAGDLEPWADAPYTNSGNEPDQVAAEMRQAVGQASAVWLIASEETLWDSRGMTRDWLSAHGYPTSSLQAARVEAIRYSLEPLP